MPLLPLEPFVFPETLLVDPAATRQEGARWWVLYTRPRAEKALARRMLAREAAFFLPLYERQFRCSGRTTKGYLPIFAGYVFLYGDEHARLHALETNLVSHVIRVEDQDQLTADLAQVYRLMDSGLALTPQPKLQPGDRVEIIDGPLAGLKAKVLKHGARLRVFVEVRVLQSAVAVEVESWMVRPCLDPV